MLQLLPGGGSDEDAHHIGAQIVDLGGALDLDIQDHILTGVHGGVHVLFGGAVEVAYVFGILQKLAVLDPLAEGLRLDEMVFHAVSFAGTGGTGGGGDGKIQIIAALEQRVENGALSHAGGAGDHKCFASFFHSVPSSSFSSSGVMPRRGASFSVLSAESTTWSLSMMRTEAVLRP